MPVGDHMALALSGRVLPAEDRRVLAAFAAQAAVVLDRQRLQHEADQARALAEGNRIRTALLAAVSHDLRTPLAGIKAAVSSLRSDDVAWSEEDEAELLEGIEDGADRLDHLVGNLLDMSRLQTGTVTPLIREIDLDEVVPMALGGVPEGSVDLDIPETPAHGRRRPRAAGARRRQPRRERRQVQPRRRAGRWSPPAPSPTGSSCGSSTAGPASPTRPRTASSSPSSATATPRAAPASASASRSPAASPRRWAARWTPRTPPAAASPWCSRSRAAAGQRPPGRPGPPARDGRRGTTAADSSDRERQAP